MKLGGKFGGRQKEHAIIDEYLCGTCKLPSDLEDGPHSGIMGPVWSGVACDRFTNKFGHGNRFMSDYISISRFLAESLPERSIFPIFTARVRNEVYVLAINLRRSYRQFHTT